MVRGTTNYKPNKIRIVQNPTPVSLLYYTVYHIITMDNKVLVYGGIFLIAVILLGGAFVYFGNPDGYTGKFTAAANMDTNSPVSGVRAADMDSRYIITPTCTCPADYELIDSRCVLKRTISIKADDGAGAGEENGGMPDVEEVPCFEDSDCATGDRCDLTTNRCVATDPNAGAGPDVDPDPDEEIKEFDCAGIEKDLVGEEWKCVNFGADMDDACAPTQWTGFLQQVPNGQTCDGINTRCITCTLADEDNAGN